MQFEETTGLSDQEFMTWLYETYAPLLWGTAKRYCRKQALREEIIQEGMVHLLACVPRLRGLQKDKLPGYLAVTVRNTTLEEQMLHSEALDELFTICDQLRTIDRELLLRYYLDDWKTPQLADHFGYQPGSVRVRLSRARRQVKQRMLESG